MRKLYLSIVLLMSVLLMISCTKQNQSENQNKYETTQRVVAKVTKDTSKELREQAAAEIKDVVYNSLSDQIKQRLYVAWGSWKPDYEGWLEWSNNLYASDAIIMAIGDTEQKFSDYQNSMRYQREACDMEMGPIMQMIVEKNVAAIIYHMYLTPKGMENAPTFDMLITEYNTFEVIDGKLMVTRLDLYTDGGNMPMRKPE